MCLLINVVLIYYTYNKLKKPGLRGDKGDQGLIGHIGDQGITGATGTKGYIGIRGVRGDINSIQGEKGIKGYKGEIGDRGLRGFMGKRGPNGEKGIKGEIGDIGLEGNPGTDGARGTPGEFNFSLIDDNSCISVEMNNITKDLKCPKEHILTGIDNTNNIYKGICCKIKLNNSCKTKYLFSYKDAYMLVQALYVLNLCCSVWYPNGCIDTCQFW